MVALRWIAYRPPPLVMIGLALTTLFVLAYVCHDRLSRTRPVPVELTEFYLWTDRLHALAVIGLGVGALAAYGTTGQTMTFYETDPAIVQIARDPELFTFLRDSRAEIRTPVGDGRILLARESPGAFDLVVVDGFTSDAIPVHLLTVEAFEIYLDRLRPDGLLALDRHPVEPVGRPALTGGSTYA